MRWRAWRLGSRDGLLFGVQQPVHDSETGRVNHPNSLKPARPNPNTALKNLRKLLKTFEKPVAFENFSRELRTEKSDRAVILMCASYVDAGLKAALLMRLPNKDVSPALFDDYATLHSLNAKIRMAEALGLFGLETRQNLDVIQTVRNAFAHSLLVVSFEAPEIAQACNALILSDQIVTSSKLTKDMIKSETPREKFIAVSMFTVGAMLYNGIGFEDKEGVRIPPPP